MSDIEHVNLDVVIIGGGGAGLRAAIAIAETDPSLSVGLVSKVVPMRSHTVAAEGGSAGVITDADSLDKHFNDTVAGGDWLCDQDAVQFFVEQCQLEMTQLEHWGCPWSRRPDGTTNVRNFGGMSTARTWFAADKTGFHILHTLFQTSLKYPSIRRFDEHFAVDLIVEDNRCQGVVTIEMASGEFFALQSRAVIMATGGAGRIFRQNTNAGIVTGDGMGMAYRHGVPLRDMEFVQYHPTTLPGSGLLITEGCRGEGGYLLNNEGYRYLQDYGLGPVVTEPTPKTMELGPRDRLSQAFWHEERKGRTFDTAQGPVVHLELMHLGEAFLKERLPFISELASTFLGIDPIKTGIPVCPSAHYTMGGVLADGSNTATPMAGLYACGECSSVGIHGANRLGSNSLAELMVFGALAGKQTAQFVRSVASSNQVSLIQKARESMHKALALLEPARTGERLTVLRTDMTDSMTEGVGIFRTRDGMQATCNKLAELRDRYRHIHLDDHSRVFNTEWLSAIELGFMLDVAEATSWSALKREESRGAHQRLDGFCSRDDVHFLKHSLAHYRSGGPPKITRQDVNITRLPPAQRVYGGNGSEVPAGPA